MDIFSLTLKSFSILNKKEMVGVYLLILASIINSLIQTLGLISIMPFIALIADPSLAESNSYILLLKETLAIESHQSLLILFASITFISLLISNTIIVIDYWASLDFFNRIGSKLSNQLLKIYLSKPTQIFYNHKISDISKKINSEVDRVIIGTQLSVISLITDIITLLVIFSLLVYINIWVSLITVTVLITAYFLVFKLLSDRINTLGNEFDKMETSVYSNLRQALDLYREIQISGKKSHFIDKFSTPNDTLYKNSTRYHVLKFLPVQLIELIAFAVVLSMSTYVSLILSNSMQAITTISIFAFAAYRFIPILKSIFDEFEEIVYSSPVLENLLSEFNQSNQNTLSRCSNKKDDKKLYLENNIQLKHISFTYDGANNPVFKQLNFQIKANQFTCISGRSGIGKSTLLDLILGLIPASSGSIYIDNYELNDTNRRNWQDNIGYVPQHTQLIEGSILDNIGFGLTKSEVDREQAMAVAKLACIDQYIDQLENHLDTIIGNGGLSLSGGEKQRIAIARSLYHRPQVLILDEATNELDNATEKNILSALSKLKNISIIFVTHKASVTSVADRVITLAESGVSLSNIERSA